MELPTTKARLSRDIRNEHQRLEEAFSGLTEEDLVYRETPGAWSIKDILSHITAWEQLLMGWYQTGLRGVKQDMPEWKKPGVLDSINQEIYERNLNRELSDVLTEFQTSYQQILAMVEAVQDDTMSVPGKFDWTGGATLAQYIMGNTNGHYAEHLQAITAIRKKRGK